MGLVQSHTNVCNKAATTFVLWLVTKNLESIYYTGVHILHRYTNNIFFLLHDKSPHEFSLCYTHLPQHYGTVS